MIPNYMKVNKTEYAASSKLIDNILKTVYPILEKAGLKCIDDCCTLDGYFITVDWMWYPFARLLKRWRCITVAKVGQRPTEDTYSLVQYHDFTPGPWEAIFTH